MTVSSISASDIAYLLYTASAAVGIYGAIRRKAKTAISALILLLALYLAFTLSSVNV